VKKKNPTTPQDIEDWNYFLKSSEKIYNKDNNYIKQDFEKKEFRKLDLHGYSLEEANKEVKKFIIHSFKNNYKKLLIITGKGLRSKVKENPYVSEKMSTLKYSVPEYIKNNDDLFPKILRMTDADISEGGEGAICVFLK
jgi:DNA-nicking Smr family endonuclease